MEILLNLISRFNLLRVTTLSNCLGLDSVVSFAFAASSSTDTNQWKSMTVYLLCKGGDVYSLCPVLPDSFEILRDQINLSSLKIDSVGEVTPQVYWTNKLVSHFQSLADEQQGDKSIILSLPTISTLSTLHPAVNGPYLQNPAPNEQDFTGIVVLQGGGDEFDMVLVSTGSGICVAVCDVACPLWQFSEVF